MPCRPGDHPAMAEHHDRRRAWRPAGHGAGPARPAPAAPPAGDHPAPPGDPAADRALGGQAAGGSRMAEGSDDSAGHSLNPRQYLWLAVCAACYGFRWSDDRSPHAGDAVSWREPGADGMLIVRCDSVRHLGVRADNGADGRGAGWSDAMKLKGEPRVRRTRLARTERRA